jgi:hypothetical protein
MSAELKTGNFSPSLRMPTTVQTFSSTLICRPSASLVPPRCFFQKLWDTTTTLSRPLTASDGRKARPSSGETRSTLKKFGVTASEKMDTGLPSTTTLPASVAVAQSSEKTWVCALYAL